MSLQLSLLEKARPRGTKIIARCPACAEQGGDRKGEHLVLFPSGKFACAAMPGDAEHRKRIHALAGERDPSFAPGLQDSAARRARQQALATATRQAHQQRQLHAAAGRCRDAVLAAYAWDIAAVRADSPQDPDDPRVRWDPRHFLASLFPPDALLWTGDVRQSGPAHAKRWRTCAEWQACAQPDEVGPFTTPAIWQPGTHTRSAANVAAGPYLVLDFDGMDGVKPQTPEEMEIHLKSSLAIIRFLREHHGWDLAAILHTGGKSLHAWFKTPEETGDLRVIADAFGVDAGLIGHPEHACRLPGAVHQGTGRRGRVGWLQLR